MNKKLFILSVLFLGILFVGHFTHAADPTPVTTGGSGSIGGSANQTAGIPGTHDPVKEGPVALIANLYDFALAVGGLLAFGSILYGAVLYLARPGDHEAQSNAKARLTDAFLGLLLLVGIYMILHIVNPGLTKLQFPILQRLKEPEKVSDINLASATTTPIDPNKTAWACVPHGYRGDQVEADPKLIKDKCYTDEKTCTNSSTCPGAGTVNDCVPVSGSVCQATNALVTDCTINGQRIADLTPLSGDALVLENGGKLEASSDAQISQNLTALQAAVNSFQTLLRARGASLTVNSMYRPIEYQRHFKEIVTDWQALQGFSATISNASTNACVALKTKVDAEHEKHGLGTVVANPSSCAPHVKGVAVDLSFSGISTEQAANLLSGSNINLMWRALSGDPVHFELKNPPYTPPGC